MSRLPRDNERIRSFQTLCSPAERKTLRHSAGTELSQATSATLIPPGQSLVSGLQLPSLKHCCEAGKKRQLDNKTGDIEKQTHGEGNRYITCSPAPDRGLGHHSRGGRPSPLCHSSKISLSPPTTTTSHDEGDEAASPDSTMTPDCPMSPGEQDAPDLICK